MTPLPANPFIDPSKYETVEDAAPRMLAELNLTVGVVIREIQERDRRGALLLRKEFAPIRQAIERR